jgi:hypothetical protein
MAQSNPTITGSPSYGFGLTQEQLVDLVRVHHPDMLEAEVRVYLNQALREFTKKTKILRGVFQKTIANGVRWYQVDDEIVSINKVYFDGNLIDRLISTAETEDLDVS